jgi:ubiquinone/menaquinone biosynthesis C-methylase UbiE
VTPAAQPARLLASTVPILPLLDKPFRTVLDLGCGSNPTVQALSLPGGAIRVGLDLDPEAVKVAQRQASGARFAAADGHVLPFRSGCFDLVIAKGAFQLMDIPVALREVNRVLCKGGQVWMTICPLRAVAMRIVADLQTARLQDAIYQSYAIVNGLLLDLVGRQFPYPFNRRRVESFQTVRGIARALVRAGFAEVRFELRKRDPGHEATDRRFGRVFAVTAKKTPA